MIITRRGFLARTVAATTSVALPMVAGSRVFGANEEVRLALVGCGGRGNYLLSQFGRQQGVRFVAVCDPDRQRLEATALRIENLFHNKPERVVDVRRLMERKDFDAVVVATMQYWHSLPTIWACQTGRDVYVEKPLSHYIWEGRQMVNAAREYNRLVQVGMQRRSDPLVRRSIRFLQEGRLGKIRYVTCFANKMRSSIGKRKEPLPIPDFIDYELWCGPARKEPIYRDRLQYDCNFVWNTCDGDSCNQGVHEVDVARWLLGETQLPRRVMSVGGRFVFDDAGDTPNTQIIFYDFPTAPVLYELRSLRVAKNSNEAPQFRGEGVGVCAHCEDGDLMVYTGTLYDRSGKKVGQLNEPLPPTESHFENFIRAIRSGKPEELSAEVLEGQISTAITHAGNISYRLGQPATPDQVRAQIGDLPMMQEMLDRYLSHLKAHEIDPGASILGPWLECDPGNECFKDNPAANELVKGYYRTPFLVPEVHA